MTWSLLTFLVNRPTWILEAFGELGPFWWRGEAAGLLSSKGEDWEELLEEWEGEREVELLSLESEEEDDRAEGDDLELKMFN